MKEAKDTPIHKKGTKPISVMPVLAKVFEITNGRLKQFIESNTKNYHHQSGFPKIMQH